MKQFDVQGQTRRSAIYVGERLKNLPAHVPAERAVIITDANVRRLYAADFPDWPVIEIGMGEGVKTLETVQTIYQGLLDLETDRSGWIIGVGGGIVCDIAGFAASTYLRGLRFGFASTTLLAQVDASVGGKNGVNFKGYKNMIGVFNQPDFVICDLETLKTLPRPEVLSGLAEIVKHALIASADMFNFIEANAEKAVNLDISVIERLVYDSVAIKADVVSRDEKEAGERRKLNFGHTLGHAVEKIAGVSHGQAVGAGMVAAADLSAARGLLTTADAERIKALLQRLGLPAAIPADKEKVLDALGKDKKREGDAVHFVLLDGIGRAVVEKISLGELAAIV